MRPDAERSASFCCSGAVSAFVAQADSQNSRDRSAGLHYISCILRLKRPRSGDAMGASVQRDANANTAGRSGLTRRDLLAAGAVGLAAGATIAPQIARAAAPDG